MNIKEKKEMEDLSSILIFSEIKIPQLAKRHRIFFN